MYHDLVERYLYAVTKRITGNMREDVARELRDLIDDMLQERCGDVLPTEKDIQVVLTELGHPSELYEKYDSDSKKCLIGAPYYTTYLFVLKTVMMCVAFGLAVAYLVTLLTSPQIIWYEAVFQWFGMFLTGLLYGFAVITLLFAVFYQKNIAIHNAFEFNNEWKINDLPPVPKKNELISKGECIFGIVFSVIYIIVFLTVPQIVGFIPLEGGVIIPFFNVEVIKQTWYIILMFGAIGIIQESIRLLERRYNKKVMVTTILAHIASAVLSCWWLLNRQIVNPDFITEMSGFFQGEDEFLVTIFVNGQYWFLGLILFSLVLDTVIVVVKTLHNP